MPQGFSHARVVVAAMGLLGAIAAAGPVGAQYVAGANVGLSVVPIASGPVTVSASATVGRDMSWTAPRTLLSLGMTARAGTDARGASLALFAQRTAEADTLAPVFAMHASAWHSIGPITLRLGLTEHAQRFAGQPALEMIVVGVDTEFVSDTTLIPAPGGSASGPGPYTVSRPATPSSVHVWSELEGGAEWALGRVRLNALVGARPPVAAFPAAMWAQAGGSIDLPHGFGLDFAAGTAPPLIGLGIPGSRFVSVGLRVQPVHGVSLPNATPPAPIAAFTVRPVGEHRFTLTYAAAAAAAVQVAGDFDAWTPIDLAQDGHGRWRATIALAPGVHHMSVRVNDGPWLAPPGTPAIPDDFGGTTGIIDIP